MKSFSIIGVLYVLSGVIATGLSNDEAQSQYSIQSLLQNLCDDHFIGTFFDEDLYNKIFQVAKYGEDSLNNQDIAMRIKNETTFEERLEYTYNVSKMFEPVCLQSACIKNDEYIECLKTNIFLSTIFHALNNNSNDLKRIIDLITDTQHEAKQTYRSAETLKQLLKLRYAPIQVRNIFEKSDSSANETSTDRDFKGNLKPQNTIGTYRGALVGDETYPDLVSQSSSKADIILEKRIRVIRGANNKTPQPSSPPINKRKDDSLELLSNANIEEEVGIPDPTEKYSISSEYPISINPTESSIQERERDALFLPENGHKNEPNVQMESTNDYGNETEISGTVENEIGLTSNLEPMKETVSNLEPMEVIDDKNEFHLREFIFKNEETSHTNDNSQIINEGANDVNEADFNSENLSSKKDVEVDNKEREVKKGSSSWSGLGSEQKKTIDSAMEATANTSSRLVFGITALLIVLGLAAGAFVISCFVLQIKSPCPLRQRSSMNINQASQSRA